MKIRVAAVFTVLSALSAFTAGYPATVAKPSYSQAMMKASQVPTWMKTTKFDWDVNKPWKEGRLEIRRLLGFMTPEKNREALTICYKYKMKDAEEVGLEWPMYLFLAGEPALAVKGYEEGLTRDLKYPPVHAYICLASCFMHFGEYQRAEKTLKMAEQILPKVDPKWQIDNEAHIRSILGDVYLGMGNKDAARKEYAESARLYPLSKQPYGRQHLKRKAQQEQAKIDILDMKDLKTAKLRDGTFKGDSIGHSDVVTSIVQIRGGRISDIDVKHKEKIQQGAVTRVPAQIIERQSLEVDAITGATKTVEAIKAGVLEALRKAGL